MESYLSEGEVVRSLFRDASKGVPAEAERSDDGAPDNSPFKGLLFSIINGAPKVYRRSISGAPKAVDAFHYSQHMTTKVFIPLTLLLFKRSVIS